MNNTPRHPKSRRARMLLSAAITVLWIAGSFHPSTAQGNSLLSLEQLRHSTELALYYAKATVLAPTELDARISFQAMLELIVGTSDDQHIGLVEQAQDIGATTDQLEIPPHTKLDLGNALSTVIAYLTAAEDAVSMVDQDGDEESLQAATQQVYAYLLAALGSDEAGFGLAGIRRMIQWLPDREIWATPGDSIQDAIDRVQPGGVIYLAPGTYTLSSSLKIGKPLTLTKDHAMSGEVLLVGPGAGSSIYVGNDTPDVAIDILILDLSILQFTNGVTVGLSKGIRWGDKTRLTLSDVVITNCLKSGVVIVNSYVVLQDCELRGNGEFGLLMPGDGTIEMSGCLITENGTPELAASTFQQTAGIHAPERALLSIVDSIISDNAGSGIHIASDVQLVLSHNQIIRNAGDGLLVWDQASVRIEDNEFLENMRLGICFVASDCQKEGEGHVLHAFTGSVEGGGNVIPGPTESGGNVVGSICPLNDYRYLIEADL